MDKQPVGQLPDLASSNNDDEIMVITNDEYNQLKKEKISDFITDLQSTNENNALTKGTDGKMFVTDFGNASNITEGTLPVSVLPDIPKDKLPEIETDDLPDSGITAGTYTYPTDIVVNSKGQVTSITEGQAGANNANQDLSNLGPLGLDKLNQSKALETGSVSSDADVYADVLKYAHSTFDKSKFEVIGSPNITDDGVVSGFSSSNSIKTNIFNPTSSWRKRIAFTTPSDFSTNQYIYTSMERVNGINIILLASQKIGVRISNNNTSYNILSRDSEIIKSDTKYYLELSFDGINTYTVRISEDGINYKTSTINSSEKLPENTTKGVLGKNSWFPGDNSFKGTIDLKSIVDIIDGQVVFSGNKTGLYIAKSDNYEVVGSPTITEDGVASGFSTANYITHGITINSSDDFEIIIPVKLNQLSNLQYFAHIIGPASLRQEGNIIAFDLLSTETTPILPYFALVSNVQIDTKYYCKLKKVGNTYIAAYKTNDIDWVIVKNVTSNLTMRPITSLVLGNSADKQRPLTDGEIDLNDIQVYINGNLVYQPCLKIPYTESKTGSKIVDAAYRDRVQDMYEQYGYAPYYTIDEENENFTLPMGEIYGMIERKNDELNNPFSLFDYKYADAPIYNMSWLQANGSWYAKSVYISAYEALVVENNSNITAGTTTTLPSGGSYTKRGLSVKLSTDSYTDTDFVINTTDETFRLPLKAALTPVTGGSIPVIGNGMAMGLINGYNSGTFTLQSNTDGAEINVNGAGQTLPYNAGSINRPQNAYVVGLSKDPAISGVIADISASTGLYLYYYVGETTQSPYIINNSQKLNNDASNLTEPGKTNIKNLVYPDFNNTVSLDITLNLVQQADKDCYLHVNAGSNSDLSVDICDADGVTKLTLISSDTVANVATIQTSPLIPAGTYFKVSRNVGSDNYLTKIYTTGESNV